jgi:hypothetical protein
MIPRAAFGGGQCVDRLHSVRYSVDQRFETVDQRILGSVEGAMGTCSYCGTPFPKTRRTRKYCTNRCRTNACLEKKPRLRAAEVEALHEILHGDFASVEAMRESLRSIVAPDLPPIPVTEGRIAIPRMD